MIADFPVLWLADGALVAFSFTAFVVQKLIVLNIVPRFVTTFLQHFIKTMLFAIAAAFVYFRDWPWPQSGSLMIHALVLFMKMHSYLATNSELEAVSG